MQFDYVLKSKAFRFDDRGMSVNCSACCPCRACSILLHPKPQMFKGVVEIDVQKFSERFGLRFVAIYDPLGEDEGPNPCHFCLYAEDKSNEVVAGIVASLMRKERDEHCGKRKPFAGSEEAAQAGLHTADYQEAFRCHTEVDPSRCGLVGGSCPECGRGYTAAEQ